MLRLAAMVAPLAPVVEAPHAAMVAPSVPIVEAPQAAPTELRGAGGTAELRGAGAARAEAGGGGNFLILN